jgi:hypothetical protein
MKNYEIFIDGTESTSGDIPPFQIAIGPIDRGGLALATKEYQTREALDADLRRYLGFNDRAIEEHFARPDLRQALVHPLSDEVAAYFGWC